MTTNDQLSAQTIDLPKPRLWPAVLIVGVYWVALFGVGYFSENMFAYFMVNFWGPVATAVLFLTWWWAFSRYPRRERLFGFLVFLITAGIAFVFVEKSMRMGFGMYALPVALTAWIAWLVFLKVANIGVPMRRIGLVAILCLAWGYFDLLRLDGVWGDMNITRNWRWTPTPEDTFLAERQSPNFTPGADLTQTDSGTEPLSLSEGDWPEFRGPLRDGQLHGVTIDTDWKKSPPQQIWRKRVGPGWSSFAVIGDRLYTQEQRREDECVLCYDAKAGGEIWNYRDHARFEEIVAGAGPRATPTFHEGRLYTLGASGKLNCLNPITGKAIWSADILTDSGAKVPMWGFSSSPLVIDGKVIVFAGGPNNKAVLAYSADDGKLAWATGNGTHSYSSAHRFLADGKPQVMVLSDIGLAAYDPADGKTIWHHDWSMDGMARVVQPHLLEGDRVVLGSWLKGTRLISVSHTKDAWATEEGWTTNALKPYFNDFVSREGFAYGIDGSLLCCIDLATGNRQWKKGRYGGGQVLLLSDQGVLLVLGEKGECALVGANPEEFVELGRFQAIEGKTWNHPVIVRGNLYVRNGEEMACYELKVN